MVAREKVARKQDVAALCNCCTAARRTDDDNDDDEEIN